MAAAGEQFQIKRAERRQSRLRLAVTGASGGGKTASSLLLAAGIVEEMIAQGLAAGTLEGKIGVIDTERGSAQLYAHLCPFDVIELSKPYTIPRFIAAMDAMERTGVLVMIVDSISHAWAGEGGLLSVLDSIDNSKRFSSFGSTINPQQDEFIDRILRASCHMIVTMRSKTAWVIEQVEKNGRMVNVPKRIGMAPVQRPGVEYEFTTLLDLDTQTHRARAIKNRCPVFQDGKEVLLTKEVGRALAQWMQEGAPAIDAPVAGTPLERAQATAEAAVRACEKAANLPDLERALQDGSKAIRSFRGVLEDDALRPMIQALVAAKDARKAALGPGAGVQATGAGDNLAPDVVAALEHLLQVGGLDLAELLEALGVQALRVLPPARVQEAARWIYHKADTVEFDMPPALQRLGVTFVDGPFTGMQDDVPF